MQSSWEPEHSQALREYLASGMSYSEIADAINAKFKTAYSRSAAIGRARRMGLAARAGRRMRPAAGPSGHRKSIRRGFPRRANVYARGLLRPMPVFERTEPPNCAASKSSRAIFRCSISKPGDCRYPYGGDAEGEAITFCGHAAATVPAIACRIFI